MAITAAQVNELRKITQVGMMECKKALVEADGDMEKAIEALRKRGIAKADKSAQRIAAEGEIFLATQGAEAALVEVNSETDFVARHPDFKEFGEKVAQVVLNAKPANVEALSALPFPGTSESIEDVRRALVAKIGENIQIRRFETSTAPSHIGVYIHGGRIGVLVNLSGGTSELARDLAMHIAAATPLVVKREEICADLVAKEREIFMAQAQESGKPADIIAKMVEGRINKFLDEVALVGQPFVKDPDTKVEKLLKSANAEVVSFIRLVLGEGIEKKQENFAEEVMAQVRGNA